jgi:hypothetical protein
MRRSAQLLYGRVQHDCASKPQFCEDQLPGRAAVPERAAVLHQQSIAQHLGQAFVPLVKWTRRCAGQCLPDLLMAYGSTGASRLGEAAAPAQTKWETLPAPLVVSGATAINGCWNRSAATDHARPDVRLGR